MMNNKDELAFACFFFPLLPYIATSTCLIVKYKYADMKIYVTKNAHIIVVFSAQIPTGIVTKIDVKNTITNARANFLFWDIFPLPYRVNLHGYIIKIKKDLLLPIKLV